MAPAPEDTTSEDGTELAEAATLFAKCESSASLDPSTKDPEANQTTLALADALASLGWGRFHWVFMLQCGLSWACDMIEIMLISFLVPNLIGQGNFIDTNSSKKDFYGFMLGAMTFVGILVGSVIFGFFADFRGRRTGYLVSTLIIAIVGLLCTASQNIETLIALRAVVGLGLGGVTCSFTLLSEMVGNQHRGKKVILSMGALWTFGGLFSASIAWICFTLLPLNWQWRLFVALSALPSLLLLLLFPFMIESPRYHLLKSQEDKAIATLRLIQKRNKLQVLPENLKLKKSAPCRSGLNQWSGLFAKGYIRTTCLLGGMWFLNMGAYYGICFITPSYFKAMHDNEYLAAFISSCSEVPGILAASWLVDALGRKWTLILFYLICGVATVILSLGQEFLPFAALVVAAVFSRGSAMGAIMALYLFTPESYPTAVRNQSLGLGSAVSRVSGIIVSYLSFAGGGSITNARTAIIVYAAMVFASSVLTFFLPVETKGKDLDAFVKDENDDG